nr:hypothetical protein HUO10_000520 [Paraburkholderia busanensis]
MKRVLKLTGWRGAWVSVWAWALTSAPAWATDDFARHFALQMEEGAAYYSMPLLAPVYAASRRGDLGDLRVLNGAGDAVPYSLDVPPEAARGTRTLRAVNWFPLPLTTTGSASASSAPSAPIGVAISADGSLRATAAPPSRDQHDTDLVDVGRASRTSHLSALLVHLRDDNYQGRVSVDASDDLRHWQPVGDAQLLKVNDNGSTLSQDRIELDGTRARYLRLHWLDGSPYVESIDMEARAGAAPAQREAVQRMWREGIVAHLGPRAGEYFFSTGGPYPVDRLRLNLPQPDTVAPARVYSRATLEMPWREVSNATLFRLRNGGVEQNSPPLEFAPDTDRQWRVVVDTRNGELGSGALTVTAGWRPATLVFAARGAAPFTLAVGNAAVESAAVSREKLLMDAASSVPAVARLGDVVPIGRDADASTVSAGSGAPRRYLLGAALVLALGSLAMLAWRLMRKLRAHVEAVGTSSAAINSASGSAIPAAASGAGVDGANVSGATAAMTTRLDTESDGDA